MLIWIVVILAAATVASITLISARFWRWSISGVLLVALVASSGMLIASTKYHWGMHQVTTVEHQQIYSAGSTKSPAGLLIAKQLGTKSGRYVMVYKTSADATKATPHFVPDTSDVVNAVKAHATYRQADVTQATVKITTTHWGWRSAAGEYWLKVGKAQNQSISKHVVVTVPKKTWLVLTAAQAKQLSQVKTSTAQAQQLKTALQQQLVAYVKQHPQASKGEQQRYLKQATAELTVKQLRATLK